MPSGFTTWLYDGDYLVSENHQVKVGDSRQLEPGKEYYGPTDPEQLNINGDIMAFEPDDVADDTSSEEQTNNDEETLLDNEGNENTESVGLDEITSTGDDRYFDLEKGDTLGLEVAEIRKNKDVKYTLSNEDYCIEVLDEDGKILSVTAWGLWGQIRQAYREAVDSGKIQESVSGLQLYIDRGEDDGDYDVKWRVGSDGDWHNVEQDD